MTPALHIPGLASQPRQGVGARLVRRFGGAVRSVIAGGITLAGSLRRPAAPQPGRSPATLRDPAAPPAPTQPRGRRRTRAAQPAPPVRPAWTGWFARWLGLDRREPAPSDRPAFPAIDAPFTPETCPGLSPEACAIFNTPLEDCDPEILHLLLAALAERIAAVMPAESGCKDAGELLATLWGRLGTALGESRLDAAAPDVTPDPAPAAPADAAPADAAPTDAAPADAAPGAPPLPPALPLLLPAPLTRALPALLSETPGTVSTDDTAMPAIAAAATTPDAAPLPGPVLHAGRAWLHASRSLRRRHVRLVHHGRRLFCRCGLRLRRGWRHRLPWLPPPRRLHYAACAGPP